MFKKALIKLQAETMNKQPVGCEAQLADVDELQFVYLTDCRSAASQVIVANSYMQTDT